jgi:hypothetical protein
VGVSSHSRKFSIGHVRRKSGGSGFAPVAGRMLIRQVKAAVSQFFSLDGSVSSDSIAPFHRRKLDSQSHSPREIPATNSETVGFQDHPLRHVAV